MSNKIFRVYDIDNEKFVSSGYRTKTSFHNLPAAKNAGKKYLEYYDKKANLIIKEYTLVETGEHLL